MSMELLREMGKDIVQLDARANAKRLVSKWDRTGLLEGLEGQRKSTMAVLLENQAAQLLKEASTVSDIIGFQNVAFPIVRRVFAGLIANELVSVQPMSLPSGLLFYLDYRYDIPSKAGNQASDFTTGGSLFGDQTAPGTENLGTRGFYNLGTSFSQREKVSTAKYLLTSVDATMADVLWDPELSASVAAGSIVKRVALSGVFPLAAEYAQALTGINDLKQWVVLSTGSTAAAYTVAGAGGNTDGVPVQNGNGVVYRRFTKQAGNDLIFIVAGPPMATGQNTPIAPTLETSGTLSFIVGSQLTGGTTGTLTLDPYESDLAKDPNAMPVIPELDFTIKSTSVTANSRKLRAKWTPELAQDLAAYQNLDAEVELTQVLSEAIALEIDREILADLLYNATGANFYWSRIPGQFRFKNTGLPAPGSFTGTVREWYETLVETVIDVANNIHRKTLRGAANFLVTSPDVATIFEASVLYKPVLSMDPKETMFTVGTEKVGTLNNRFTVYKDPYFPRNRILVGYKGGSFLETGYVYAPYVPLIVTPTIYAPEDFTPRKGVMTRYAKKLVRSDFYGTVTVQDMNVI
jgi:hypothetical protein